jgi:predicted ATPase
MRTDITIQFNMGFMDGEEERKMQENEAQDNLEGLIQHMKDILPEPDDLDLETKIQSIVFKSLEIGKWTSCDRGTWAALTTPQSTPDTYNMQLTVTLHHKSPQSYATMADVIEAIYENGANFSMTPEAEDAMPHRILYPYSSIGYEHLVAERGESDESDDDDDDDD